MNNSSWNDLFSAHTRDLKESGSLEALPRDEERALIERAQTGDQAAIDQLVRSHIRIVWKIAWRFSWSDLSLSDLVQEGNLGLLRAIQKYEEGKGAKLSTYAEFWIRSFIKRAIANQTGHLRTPVHVAEIIGRIRRVTHELSQRLDSTPTDEEIAEEVGRPVEFVQRYLVFVRRRFSSLDAPMNGDDSNDACEQFIADPNATEPSAAADRIALSVQIEKVLAALRPHERFVLEHRFGFRNGGETLTLEEVGKRCGGITRERVRQIESKALRKLRSPRLLKLLKTKWE